MKSLFVAGRTGAQLPRHLTRHPPHWTRRSPPAARPAAAPAQHPAAPAPARPRRCRWQRRRSMNLWRWWKADFTLQKWCFHGILDGDWWWLMVIQWLTRVKMRICHGLSVHYSWLFLKWETVVDSKKQQLLGGSTHLETYISQWEGWHPIYEMEK